MDPTARKLAHTVDIEVNGSKVRAKIGSAIRVSLFEGDVRIDFSPFRSGPLFGQAYSFIFYKPHLYDLTLLFHQTLVNSQSQSIFWTQTSTAYSVQLGLETDNMGVTKTQITPGNGVDKAKEGDTITMEYTGTLYDENAADKKGKQ